MSKVPTGTIRRQKAKNKGEKPKVLNGAAHAVPSTCALCDSLDHTSAEHEAHLVCLEETQLAAYNAACLELFDDAAVADYELTVEDDRDPPDKKGKKKSPPPEDGTIRITIGSLEDNTLEAIALLAANDPTMYQRAGELVRVVRITEAESEASKDSEGNKTVHAGTPMIKRVPETNLLMRMSSRVPCERYNKKEDDFVPCDVPSKLARSILELTEYPDMRALRGIAESPFLRPDGTVMQKPGYDKHTGYLYAPNADYPLILEKPSQADAREAFKVLWHVYAGLEFVDDAARACPIAGIMTIFAQGAIRGCVPIFMTEANTPGSGKTIVNDTIGIIAAGRPMPRRSFPGPGDELRKVLDSYALDGTRFFCLDNIGQDFGGEALEAAVTTEGHYDLRVLGETRNMRVEWRTIVFGSGNNIGFCRADIIPRTLMSRLETQFEDPRSRDMSTFLIKEHLLGYVRRERVHLVVAALTILRAYAHAGRPPQGQKPWGSFEAWNSWVAPAILFAGGPDISTCRLTGDKAHAVDTDSQHLAMILDEPKGLPLLCVRLEESMGKKVRWLTAASIIDSLYNPALYMNDEKFDPLRAALEGLTSKKRTGDIKPNPTGLGIAFQRSRAQVVNGRRLVGEFDSHLGAHLWTVEIVADEPPLLGGSSSRKKAVTTVRSKVNAADLHKRLTSK